MYPYNPYGNTGYGTGTNPNPLGAYNPQYGSMTPAPTQTQQREEA